MCVCGKCKRVSFECIKTLTCYQTVHSRKGQLDISVQCMTTSHSHGEYHWSFVLPGRVWWVDETNSHLCTCMD